MNALRSYARTQAETASPERLTVLLFEKALFHMRSAATALEGGQQRAAIPVLEKASNIVLQLMATLDRSKAPQLCDNLTAVYQYVVLRLTVASLKGEAKAARDAERAFAPLADAFSQAVTKVASGTR